MNSAHSSCSYRLALFVLSIAGLTAADAAAQPLGAFYWQLAPFCNVVVLHITQHVTPPGAVYALTGFDDHCGATDRATALGTATFNHDGSIGVGLAIVTTPTGTPVHVDARLSLSSLSGPWSDSAGNAGTFVPLPTAFGASLRDRTSAVVAGAPRPVPPSGIALGSITAQQLAPGAVGGGQIDPNQVQTRVAGECPAGQSVRAINANGTVQCGLQLALPTAVQTTGVARPVTEDTVVHSVELAIPGRGLVLVQASGNIELARTDNSLVRAMCSVSIGPTLELFHVIDVALSTPTNILAQVVPFTRTRGFDVTPGTFKANLVCSHFLQGSVIVKSPNLTALFLPTP